MPNLSVLLIFHDINVADMLYNYVCFVCECYMHFINFTKQYVIIKMILFSL